MASAGDGGPPPRVQNILGMVLPAHASGGSLGAGALKYHNGPVMHVNTSYAIYWVPSGYSVSSDYQSLINRFFTDVAADSGKTSNVYYSDTQYYDGSGHIAYSSTFGGFTLDTNAFPASGCSDTVSQTTICLSDAQLQAEIQRVISAQGWTAGPTHEFFLFTPRGVGSCAGSSCAFSQYCAYHSWIGSGSSVVLYANQPYTDTVPAACDATAHPNNSEADPTINVVSHEHNETITDPNGNAWYDSAGYENGDKCAWKFGTSIGSTAYGAYNQLINGNPYELQQEYSNAHRGCVLTGT
ncbi:MAG TPA: hypothetical protein VMU73_11225 [Gaiellaceae bacterium]|nr:hypothetical protein [Gaiellaceae bacterium]